MFRAICIALLAMMPVLTHAQGTQSLKDLMDEVTANASTEAKRNKEREAKFRAAAGEQESLMASAEAEVKKQEALRDSLRKTFDENETVLAELQDLLDRRSGDLGELFGVFRQTADDAESIIFASLISAEKPERKAIVSELAESAEIPSIDQIRSLWQLLIQETALSGELSRFKHEVINPDGTNYDADIVRVGAFNVVTGDKYLNYLSEDGTLVELARQPAGYARSSADTLTSAAPGEVVDFTIDPSRGALLGLLVQSPSLMERIEQGGTVGYAIIIVGIIGMLIVLERMLSLMRTRSKMQRQLKNLDQVEEDNPIGRVMQAYFEHRHLDLETISRKMQEVIIHDMAGIRRGLSIVKVLAAVAPLMGLLGTVVGMIGTFQAITLFGTGDPKLMAGGISQALITTVLGLCAAIPLLLSHSMLAARATQIGKMISEQAAGLMAKKAEADAKGA
ncbi:MotA/TolQ/ExbB proton channel family protein [Teredinibacter turnerae]|uniref:MotA/TolQ/ExbB proton channel family protein n=1 Tax=Teredinibacter turnerae TaxID=2426 RepID=UPI00036C21EA|nr:MotA/TolQ/ExbB proton channel family protein [Teredinibacter turnerae]